MPGPEQQAVIAKARGELDRSGITEERRRSYLPVLSPLARRMFEPAGYGAPSIGASIDNFIRGRNDDIKSVRPCEDAWRMYLGIPQTHNTFGISDYAPTNSLPGVLYYKINGYWEKTLGPTDARSTLEEREAATIAAIKHTVEALKAQGRSANNLGVLTMGKRDGDFMVMGNYRLSLGTDAKGVYLSYYDKWDLNTTRISVIDRVWKPFEIYDRLYFDPKSFAPSAGQLNLSK